MHPRFVRLALAAATVLAACGPAPGQHAPEPAPAATGATFPALSGRVVDEADLLDAALEARLARDLEELESRTTDQMVIVTVPSLDDRPIEIFSRDLGNHWGVGRSGKDNGVLIVVAPLERKVRIEVGYGLEEILTDARAAEIIDRDMLPPFRAGRPDVAVENGTRAVVATLIAHAHEPRQRRR